MDAGHDVADLVADNEALVILDGVASAVHDVAAYVEYNEGAMEERDGEGESVDGLVEWDKLELMDKPESGKPELH